MKKILIMIITILFICGCKTKEENKYSNFKHYNLKEKDINYYNYIDDKENSNFYTFTRILL